jgi:chromatin remodeling complex protein RSC6
MAKKKATKKKVAKKKTTKKKAKTKRKPNAAFMKALTPSADLAAVVGGKALPRTQAVKKIWDYIKKHKLQNPKNRRNILADDKLKKLFGKKEITMFELAKIINKHLS